MIETPSGAPKNYAELEEHYRGFVEKLVRKGGITSQDVEDVASDILYVFQKRGALDWYDETKVHKTPSGPRTAKFATFLGGFVNLYLRSARDKQALRIRREPFRLGTPGISPESESTGLWDGGSLLPALPPSTEPEVDDWIVSAFHLLETAEDPLLAEIFRRTMEQVWGGEKVSRHRMAQEMGCSDTVVSRRFREIRQILVDSGMRDQLVGVA